MQHFAAKPLVLAMTLAAPAWAQQAAVPVSTAETGATEAKITEEVIVTGSYRESLANPLEAKRVATGSVDAIMAEDIADFPDNNLAESLQRIPGVAISRAAGEGRQISVRGLGPDYTRVRINGMEAIATSGGTDAIGGANRGRGFDFNTFSSDLFSSLIVRKTASADVEEGSLGATVDLKAAQPFDFNELTVVANAQAGYNDLSEEVDPKVSLLASNVFNDVLGALISVSYSERGIVDNGASAVRWDNTNDFTSCSVPDCSLDDVNLAFRPRLPRYDSYTHEMERLGLSGSLQYQPTDNTEISLDILYSKHDAKRNEVFMQAVLNSTPTTQTMTVVDYEVDSADTMTYGVFENALVRSENRYDELSTTFKQVTLSAEHEFNDALKLTAMVGQAESEFDNPIQTTMVMQKSGLDFSYDYRGGFRENPQIVFGDDASADPLQRLNAIDGWTANSLRLRPLGANNTFDVAQADLEFELNDNIRFKGGLHFKKFEFETYEARRVGENTAGIVIDANNTSLYEADIGPQGTWLIPSLAALQAQYDIYSNTGVFAVSPENRLVDNYSAEEETLGIYVQMAFDVPLEDSAVRGDVGFRHVDTDQSSTGWVTGGDAIREITKDHSYDDILPSMNLVFQPFEMDNILIRASYAQVLTRAALDLIRPNVSVSVAGTNRTVSGGNPTLEPTKAKTYDLGLEVYFENDGAFSTSVFKKDIESFVQNLTQTRLFTETGLPVSAAEAACNAGPDGYGPACNENLEWNTSTPLNGPGGDLYGFEVSYQQPFIFLPGIWGNFGILSNYTYVKSQLDYVDEDGKVLVTRDLEGLSESTRSATLYYEDEKFSARISTVTRSAYITRALGRNNNDMEGTNATTNVDAAASYKLTDNWKISFEALNLTNEADDQWVDSVGNRLSYYHETGKQYYLGVQYKF